MSDNNDDDGPLPYANHVKTVLEQGVVMGNLPKVTTDPNLLEEQARKEMVLQRGFEYIRGSAGEAATMHANRLAFRSWKIIPRMMRPTGDRDLSVTLFGKKYRSPLLMAPLGVQGTMHPDKEIGNAQACAELGVPFTLSTSATTGIEELVAASPEGDKWFQLYWPQDEEITASILTRAKKHGYQTLVVTLDTWIMGWRPSDLDTANIPFLTGVGDEVGFQDPVFRRKFAERTDGETPEESPILAGMYWCSEIFPGVSRSWDEIRILRKYWDGPMVVKGVLSVEDAQLAVEYGLDGVIVSNHGGRQVDGAIASLDALPGIAQAVGSKITVMMDSGIRTGADIFKALCLGAQAVFVGRPVVYGLGIAGKDGAYAVLANLLADLDITMGISGVKNIAELNPSRVAKIQHPGDVRSNL
ncbi:Alpha-hydroxy acid FMN-dependent [Cordyceps militaris]|uniref:Alpha-hydroxy acid FMN-dependent n=1 Tax=Cordyceps militaris TaxID=73501 RepID=A0A2H4S9G9_CORMI|nr:Alpha-hydroxy acid FMN-dependent [Cordyceps militaris]